eukprot:COSAG05_NODE_339_length_11118_cov_3.752246_1_plen_152_part_00
MHRTPWATGDSHSLGSHVTHHQGGPPRARHQNQSQNSFGAYKSRGEAVAARAQMRANNVDIQLEQMREARYALLPSCARAPKRNAAHHLIRRLRCSARAGEKAAAFELADVKWRATQVINSRNGHRRPQRGALQSIQTNHSRGKPSTSATI